MKKSYRHLLVSTIIAALGGFLFGFDTAVISGTTASLQGYFNLSEFYLFNGFIGDTLGLNVGEFWLGFSVATALLGTIAGSLLVSRPSQVWGRRNSLVIMAVFYTVSAAGTAFSTSIYAFWFFRFVGGIAVGGASVLSPMYIAEISPPKDRGKLVGWQQFNVCFGICMAYISNYFVASIPIFTDGITGWMAEWRWMYLMEVFPAILFFILLFRIPFSPRWLVGKGRTNEARNVLQGFGDETVEHTLSDIEESMQMETQLIREKLMKRKYLIPVIGAVALGVFNQFSGINALLYYAPKVFNMGGSTGDAALLQSIPVGLMLVISTTLGLAIIDRVGRKALLIIGSLGMAFFLIMVGIQFNNKGVADDIGVSIMIYFIGYILFFGPSTGAVIWVFISEIFPNKIRSKGQALGSFSVWVSAAMVTQLFPVAASSKSVGPGYSFIFFALCMVAQAIFVWLVMPETKGISLEDLQKKLGIK